MEWYLQKHLVEIRYLVNSFCFMQCPVLFLLRFSLTCKYFSWSPAEQDPSKPPIFLELTPRNEVQQDPFHSNQPGSRLPNLQFIRSQNTPESDRSNQTKPDSTIISLLLILLLSLSLLLRYYYYNFYCYYHFYIFIKTIIISSLLLGLLEL